MFRQNLVMVRLKGVPPTSNFFFIFDLFQTIIVSMGQVSFKYESYFWKFEISIFSGGQEPKNDPPRLLDFSQFLFNHSTFFEKLFYTYRNMHLKLVDSLKIRLWTNFLKSDHLFTIFSKLWMLVAPQIYKVQTSLR